MGVICFQGVKGHPCNNTLGISLNVKAQVLPMDCHSILWKQQTSLETTDVVLTVHGTTKCQETGL